MKLLAFFLLLLPCAYAQLPASCQQVIVGVASGWNDSRVNLHLYEKTGGNWRLVDGPWPGRLGKNGLAWGRGIHPVPASAEMKREGDRRAPAGIFSLGGAFGYAPAIARSPRLPYRQITTRDLFVEDVGSRYYNQHLVLDHEPRTTWEKKAQMRQGDHAHSLKLFINHNVSPSAVKGGGSAIFFHIWRGGGSKATFGCTTMSEAKLKSLIARIDPAKNPHYVLLPQAEYTRLRGAWRLP